MSFGADKRAQVAQSGPSVLRSGQEIASTIPICRDERFRIEMTTSCRDCNALPKVPGAGSVIIEDGHRVQLMHNGLRVAADEYYGAWMTETIRVLRGHHEPQEELVFNAILQYAPEQATMIEVGGFWSYYSLWFLQSQPGRRAIVIEPDPNHLQVGRRNASLNRQTSIEFLHAFVGPEDGIDTNFQTESFGGMPLQMINLGNLISQRDIDVLDVLHCDAQGAEIDVIRTCERHLKVGRIRFLVLSTHADAITGDPLTHQICLDAIQRLGGQIIAEHDVYESYSGDGLIVAYFGAPLVNWPKLEMSYNRYSTSLFRNPSFDIGLARARVTELENELAVRRGKAFDKGDEAMP